jgi:hypothetical protein
MYIFWFDIKIEKKYDPYYNDNNSFEHQTLHNNQMYNFVFNHYYKIWNIIIINDI